MVSWDQHVIEVGGGGHHWEEVVHDGEDARVAFLEVFGDSCLDDTHGFCSSVSVNTAEDSIELK